MLHGATRRQTQGAGSSLLPSLRGAECVCRRDQAPAGVCLCNRCIWKLRLIEQACGCCTGRNGGGLMVYACLCHHQHFGVESMIAAVTMCLMATLKRSRREAPTDRASLQVLHGATRRQTQGAGSSLLPSLRGAECVCRRDQAPAGVCLCNRCIWKLRLIEQACGCCTGRNGGGLMVYACLCHHQHFGVESMIAAVTMCLMATLKRSRREAPTDRASLPVLHRVGRRRRTQGAFCFSLQP